MVDLSLADGRRREIRTHRRTAELFVVGARILRLTAHLFRHGAIACGKKLSIAGTFRPHVLATN